MKNRAGHGGAGRKSFSGKKPAGRKHSMWGRIFLALITCTNLVLSLVITAQRRRDVVTAVQNDDGTMKLLLTAEKRTKSVEKPGEKS